MPPSAEQRALAWLGRDSRAHVDLLTPIRRGSADILAADGGGVLLYERASGAHMLACTDEADAARLLGLVEGPALLSVHHTFAARQAEARFGLSVILTCRQAVWPGDTPPPVPASPLGVRAIPPAMAEAVTGLYSHDIGLPYIQGRIRAGQLWGAFEGDTLAGFIGVHAEGGMGMLEVVPAFRRRGVGRLLAAWLCARLLGQGLRPFSQFSVDNTASAALNAALGLCVAPDIICWLE